MGQREYVAVALDRLPCSFQFVAGLRASLAACPQSREGRERERERERASKISVLVCLSTVVPYSISLSCFVLAWSLVLVVV